jgi:hypothetical protein
MLSQQVGYKQDAIVVRTFCKPSRKAEAFNTVLWQSRVVGSVNDHKRQGIGQDPLPLLARRRMCGRWPSPVACQNGETGPYGACDWDGYDDGGSGMYGLGICLIGPGSGIVEGKLLWGSGGCVVVNGAVSIHVRISGIQPDSFTSICPGI